MRGVLAAVFLAGVLQAEEQTAARENPAPREVTRTLEDGTVQGFILQLTGAGEFLDFSIQQLPGTAESAATGAILYAIPAETGMPHTLHLRIDPPAAEGTRSDWNFKKEIAAAIAKKQFPSVVAPGTVITLQFLRGRKGVSIGTPITLGGAPAAAEAPARGKSGCRAGECFAERFAACKTARLDSKTSIDLSYRYEILGPVEEGCRVRSTFILHPDENWAGKSMVCVYDAAKPFAESILAPLSCTGALAEAMRGE